MERGRWEGREKRGGKRGGRERTGTEKDETRCSMDTTTTRIRLLLTDRAICNDA